jgi:hypothetical protein
MARLDKIRAEYDRHGQYDVTPNAADEFVAPGRSKLVTPRKGLSMILSSRRRGDWG